MDDNDTHDTGNLVPTSAFSVFFTNPAALIIAALFITLGIFLVINASKVIRFVNTVSIEQTTPGQPTTPKVNTVAQQQATNTQTNTVTNEPGTVVNNEWCGTEGDYMWPGRLCCDTNIELAHFCHDKEKPYILVTNPINGGMYKRGSTISLHWDTMHTTSRRMSVYLEKIGLPIESSVIEGNIPDVGSYDWTIDSAYHLSEGLSGPIEPGIYTISVLSTENDTGANISGGMIGSIIILP